MKENNSAAPVAPSERILILDSLRGIALLGILLMNIPGFGLPEIQAGDPTILNESEANFQTWYTIELIFTGTQRAFFSMLFGAGIVLFISRLEKRLDGIKPAEYFFRRQLWLMFFGIFNGFILLWFWDILFNYAVCGMLLFAFYRLPARSLLYGALICLVLMTIRENRDLYVNKNIIAKGEQVLAKDTSKVKLTPEEKDDLEAMQGLKEKSKPASKRKVAEKELRAIRGSYEMLYNYQSEKSLHVELYYTYFLIWDVLLFMFLGMAFYKNGILPGDAPARLYWIFFTGGLGVGILLSWLRLEPILINRFNNYDYTKSVSFDYFEIARTLRSLGFFGMVMLMYKSGWFNWFFKLMRPVGQMAFTNYLMQSFMGGLYFYGVGFGKFGELQRYELYYYVAVVWAIEIIWSHIWLRFFRYGPVEWLWRSLTYWKWQPLKKD